MSTYKGFGRLYFRPKNTKKAPDGIVPILIAGMIAFQEPTALEKYAGYESDLDNIPREQLVDVEITVRIIARYGDDSDVDPDKFTDLRGWRIDQIITSRQYSNPEECGMVRRTEVRNDLG